MTRPIAFTRPDQRQVELMPWSDQDLNDMAIITEDDQQRAQSYWRRIMPRRFRTLLDAISTVARGL